MRRRRTETENGENTPYPHRCNPGPVYVWTSSDPAHRNAGVWFGRKYLMRSRRPPCRYRHPTPPVNPSPAAVPYGGSFIDDTPPKACAAKSPPSISLVAAERHTGPRRRPLCHQRDGEGEGGCLSASAWQPATVCRLYSV